MRHVWEFYCLEGIVEQAWEQDRDNFKVGEASQRGLSEHDGGVVGEEDLDDVLGDIEVAHKVMAGARAGRFIVDLLNWDGVTEAIAAFGGWKRLEGSAKLIEETGLEGIAVDEAHFVLLKDVKELKRRLVEGAGRAKGMERAAQNCLNDMWGRFKCGKVTKGGLRRNPGLGVIRQTLVEGNAELVYPGLGVPEDEDE